MPVMFKAFMKWELALRAKELHKSEIYEFVIKELKSFTVLKGALVNFSNHPAL